MAALEAAAPWQRAKGRWASLLVAYSWEEARHALSIGTAGRTTAFINSCHEPRSSVLKDYWTVPSIVLCIVPSSSIPLRPDQPFTLTFVCGALPASPYTRSRLRVTLLHCLGTDEFVCISRRDECSSCAFVRFIRGHATGNGPLKR